MIYFTTFTLTLILSHVVRATPACGDISPPEELYNPTYADYADDQNTLPNPFCNVAWSSYYDNPNGDTNKVACNNFAHRYPHFHNIPRFPYIGGAWNIKRGSRSCFSCWNLTDVKTRKTIFVTVINSAKSGGVISKEAFNVLNGGPGTCLEALAREVTPYPCGLKE
jgi:hypothetical protein